MKCKWVHGRKRRAFLVGVEPWGDGKWLGLKVGRRRGSWTREFRTEAGSLQNDRGRECVCMYAPKFRTGMGGCGPRVS